MNNQTRLSGEALLSLQALAGATFLKLCYDRYKRFSIEEIQKMIYNKRLNDTAMLVLNNDEIVFYAAWEIVDDMLWVEDMVIAPKYRSQLSLRKIVEKFVEDKPYIKAISFARVLKDSKLRKYDIKKFIKG